LTCLKEELYGKLTVHDRILCMDEFRPLLQGGHRTSCDRNDLIELLSWLGLYHITLMNMKILNMNIHNGYK
jgi:hypothetical protein